jgi:hypothetical protein
LTARLRAGAALLLCLAAGTAAAAPDFGLEAASDDVRRLAGWIVDSADNQQMPFVIVDKKLAKVFLFRPAGELTGAVPALLGQGHGDDTVPGIGERKLSSIAPAERTTPAGRFVASLGTNLQGKEILWIDYAAAISLHRVVTANAAERRAQRLASPSALDNRISYGCINVPVAFFERMLMPAFKHSSGVVYILPEGKPVEQVFATSRAAP